MCCHAEKWSETVAERTQNTTTQKRRNHTIFAQRVLLILVIILLSLWPTNTARIIIILLVVIKWSKHIATGKITPNAPNTNSGMKHRAPSNQIICDFSVYCRWKTLWYRYHGSISSNNKNKRNVTSGQKRASLVRHAQGHHPEEEKWLFILFVNLSTKTILV